MSVAMSAAGGAGGYMPMQTVMPQMKAPNYNQSSTSGSSNFRMPSLAAPSEGNKDLRGDLSGDECLTLDVDDVVLSATWQEGACECLVSAASLPSDQSYDPDARANLGKVSLFVTESVRKLVQRSATAQASQEADTGKKAKNKKKKRESSLACGKGGITLVLPCAITQRSLRSASLSVAATGCTVKNIFGRGIATVTGILARSAGLGSNSGPANNLITVLDAKRKSGSSLSDYPVVLYLYFRNELDGDVSVNGSMIVLESGNGVKNNLGYERLSTLAVVHRVSGGRKLGLDHLLGDVRSHLLQAAQIDQERVSAIVFAGNGGSGEDEKERSAAIGKLFPATSVPVYRALKEDAARGGCLLSAGELDSSKEYLQQPDGSWVVAYQLPVADGYMSKQIGLIVQHGPSDVDAKPEIIFSSRRLWKPEIGPIRPGSIATQEEGLTRVTRDYSSVTLGPLSFASKLLGRTVAVKGASTLVYGVSGDWPKLRLVERESVGDPAAEDPWQDITGEDILPLVIKSPSGVPSEDSKKGVAVDPVEKCTVTFFLNPASGLVCVSQEKGKMVKERRAEMWFWTQVALSLVFIALLLTSPWTYSYLRERSVKAEHIRWLKSFYLLHAPEKLKDPLYVERTVLKYKGRMFLLWRGLKRTYSVDFPAPSSILEGVGMDL